MDLMVFCIWGICTLAQGVGALLGLLDGLGRRRMTLVSTSVQLDG